MAKWIWKTNITFKGDRIRKVEMTAERLSDLFEMIYEGLVESEVNEILIYKVNGEV